MRFALKKTGAGVLIIFWYRISPTIIAVKDNYAEEDFVKRTSIRKSQLLS